MARFDPEENRMLTDEPVVPILLATDLAASRRFYEDVLGLPVQQSSESTVTYAWGGQPRLRLSASSEGTKDSQTQATWIVRNLRSEVDALRTRGAEFEEYDTDDVTTEDGIADQGEAYVAWLTDPGGNVIGVEQAK